MSIILKNSSDFFNSSVSYKYIYIFFSYHIDFLNTKPKTDYSTCKVSEISSLIAYYWFYIYDKFS